MSNQNEIDIPRIEDFIKRLKIKDLIYLNGIIIDRIKVLQQINSSEKMTKFHVGQRVSFSPEGAQVKEGRVTRLNKKTVSVITDDNENWKVGTGLLKSID